MEIDLSSGRVKKRSSCSQYLAKHGSGQEHCLEKRNWQSLGVHLFYFFFFLVHTQLTYFISCLLFMVLKASYLHITVSSRGFTCYIPTLSFYNSWRATLEYEATINATSLFILIFHEDLPRRGASVVSDSVKLA
jgi:hypothetical protein